MTLSVAEQDKQVAVVAGTAADANRVAYVKTVRPSSGEVDERPESELQPSVQPRYTNEVRSQVTYSSKILTNQMKKNISVYKQRTVILDPNFKNPARARFTFQNPAGSGVGFGRKLLCLHMNFL